MISSKCLFIGYECEGNDRKTKTLFVSDQEIAPERILQALMDNPDVNAVYFGACSNFGISENHIPILGKLIRSHTVRLEINTPEQLKKIPHNLVHSIEVIFVVPVSTTEETQHINAIKLVSDRDLMVFYSKGNPEYTSFNNPEYKKDIIL
jgi:hypothetical protein